jgi:hypothetical protein
MMISLALFIIMSLLITTTSSTCVCPDRDCRWPLLCDCNGTCSRIPCDTNISACDGYPNPQNACQILKCNARNVCQPTRLTCDGCLPLTGCP